MNVIIVQLLAWLEPVPHQPPQLAIRRVDRWVSDTDAGRFAEREQATDKLQAFCDRAWKAFASDPAYGTEIAECAMLLAQQERRDPAMVNPRDTDSLTDTEFRFLLYMTTKPPGWRFYTSHLAQTTGRSERSIQRLLPSLVRRGTSPRSASVRTAAPSPSSSTSCADAGRTGSRAARNRARQRHAALTSLRAASRASPDQPGAEAGGQQWQQQHRSGTR